MASVFGGFGTPLLHCVGVEVRRKACACASPYRKVGRPEGRSGEWSNTSGDLQIR